MFWKFWVRVLNCCLLAFPAAGYSLAAPASPDQLTVWIDQILNGVSEKRWEDANDDGSVNCRFTISHTPSNLVLTLHGAAPVTPESYIGLFVDSYARITFGSRKFIVHSDRTWGNSSQWNEMTIELEANGFPARVIGRSDLQTITCG